jgi:CBS domain-containing protein
MNTYDTIRDVLKRKGQEVWSITPDSTVYRAIEMMADKHIGALLVIVDEKLVGIVSERDYARKVVLRGRSSKETRVAEIMTSPVIFVEPRHVVDECMRNHYRKPYSSSAGRRGRESDRNGLDR